MADPNTLTWAQSHNAEFLEYPALEVVCEAERGVQVRAPLGLTALRIGSHPDCDLVMTHPSLSRVHCEVRITDRGVRLRDLGSKNGVTLHDVSILEALLPPGTTALLGGVKLWVEPKGENRRIPLAPQARFGEAVGGSPLMRALFHQLARAAVTEASVLLRGESGTGKEVLARAIHGASARAGRPFVVLDCSAIAPTVLEAELCGYERGAFPGAEEARVGLLEAAHGGTVFIDEVGELPLEAQSRLLRALETREIRPLGSSTLRPADARVVAATHRDLRARLTQGTFRKDLFFRLAVVELEIPALRERKEDIPLLVEQVLAHQSPRRTLADLPPHTLRLLEAHDWPGNVRELRNTVTRLLLFPELALAGVAAGPGTEVLEWREARERAITAFEGGYLRERLREHGGNVTAAAKAMKVSRQFLHELIARHHLGGQGS